MLKLSYLKEITLPEVWSRGENYFYNGLVGRLKCSENDWTAVVEGSYNYRVAVTVNENEIEDWDCNCPYDHGPVCKHVVAVALAVEEQLQQEGGKVISDVVIVEDETDSSPVPDIQKIPAKDLKRFCEAYAREHPDFINGLTAFVNKPVQKKKINYAQKIRKAADQAAGRHDFIDYYHAPQAFNKVFDFLDKADELLSGNDFDEAFEIARSVFEEVSEMCQYMDDSDGMAGDSLYHSEELIHNIITAAPDEMKNKVFNWLMAEYPKKKYQNFLGDDMLLDLVIEAAKLLHKNNSVIPLLDQAMKGSDSAYKQERLVLKKADLLIHAGQVYEAEELIGRNLHFPDIRSTRLEKLMQEKQYPEAEKLIKEGIEIAREKQHPGTEIKWCKQLMEVYNKTGDTKKQLELTRRLFEIDSQSRTAHLESLKIFFNDDEWKDERAKLASWLKEKKDRYLFRFFAHENMIPELFELIKKNPHFHYLREYGQLLMNDYAGEILKMYAAEFNKMAAVAGNRGAYRELASNLKELGKLEGGKALVKQLVAGFRISYKKRPAMMEELSVFK